jgi:5-methylcytosine-specific restriction endonuclease McrA
MRKAILQRDSFTCRYCGEHPAKTIDHVLAFSRGGKSTYDNLVVSCPACQLEKDNLTLEECGMALLPLHPLAVLYEEFRSARTQWGYWDGTH